MAMSAHPPVLGYNVPLARKLLGKKLKDLRNHYNWYRPTVCKMVQVRCSPSHLRDIETGRSEPRFSLLIHLANLYGVSITYLVGDDALHFKLRDSMENLSQGLRRS